MTKLRGRLPAMLIGGAVLLGLAGETPSDCAKGVLYTLSYQLTFNDGSPLNGQLTDAVTGRYALSCGDVANVPGLAGLAALQTFTFDDAANANAQLTVNAGGSGSFVFPDIRPDQYTPKLVPDGSTLAGSLTWACS